MANNLLNKESQNSLEIKSQIINGGQQQFADKIHKETSAGNYIEGDAIDSNFANRDLYNNCTIQQAATIKTLPKLYQFPPLTQFFSNRDTELDQLHRLLQSKGKAMVYGMGGLGKSELVNQYARLHQADYAHLLWLSAETGDILQMQLRQLAEVFGIEDKEHWFELLLTELNRLSGILLILDNLDEFEGLEWQKLQPWVDSLRGCDLALLITSRCEALSDIAAPLSLKLWQAEQARRFLVARTGKNAGQTETETAALSAIIAEFAGLPLALEQAGAYIKQKRIGFVQYWQLYQQEKSQLLSFKSVVLNHQPLLITLQLALEKQSAAVRQLFNLCALLNGDAIPEEVLDGLIEGDYCQARNTLLDYSLLEHDAENRYLRQHRLLQRLAKSFLKPEQQKTLAEAVINQVNDLFPYVELESWETCQRLVLSAFACEGLSGEFALETENMARLDNQLAIYLYFRHADYAEALPLYRRSLAIWEKVLEENHPDVAQSLNNLALLYNNQGRYEEALPLYQRSLAIWEKVLGESHPDVATSLNNLAVLYKSQGRVEEALPLYQRSLAIREKALGENHPDVAQSLNNLALLYDSQGRYGEALPLYQKALEIMEKSLGTEHPDTKIVVKNYALLQKQMGK